MFKFITSEWDEYAESFMRKQGRHRRATGKHYFAADCNGKPCWIISIPRIRIGYVPGQRWAEINTFSDLNVLFQETSLTHRQRRACRHLGLYFGLSWAFNTMNVDGIYGRVEENNQKVINFMLGVAPVMIPTEEYAFDGVRFYQWRYTRQEFWQSDFYKNALKAVQHL